MNERCMTKIEDLTSSQILPGQSRGSVWRWWRFYASVLATAGAGGIMFPSWQSVLFLWICYFRNTLGEFLQIWLKHSFGPKDELIRFWSRSQNHGLLIMCDPGFKLYHCLSVHFVKGNGKIIVFTGKKFFRLCRLSETFSHISPCNANSCWRVLLFYYKAICESEYEAEAATLPLPGEPLMHVHSSMWQRCVLWESPLMLQGQWRNG